MSVLALSPSLVMRLALYAVERGILTGEEATAFTKDILASNAAAYRERYGHQPQLGPVGNSEPSLSPRAARELAGTISYNCEPDLPAHHAEALRSIIMLSGQTQAKPTHVPPRAH